VAGLDYFRGLLEKRPDWFYGSVLPIASDPQGGLHPALPDIVRGNARGILDLLEGPKTGNMTPEATGALGLLGGAAGAEFGEPGALASGAARMAKPAFPWRPIEDVAAEVPKEVPPHVQAFGGYMQDMADKASGPGLSPRDVVKGYAITRSSIQRGAIGADKLRENWPEFAGSGKIRPEGAFSDWLFTPHGQSYLDAAQKGLVDEPAVADAVGKLRGFGKGQDLQNALTVAPAVGESAPRVSALVAAGYQNPGVGIDQWRDWSGSLPGIGPAKSGFIASLLGRGDQPTLDARQILLQTGRPTAGVKNYVSSSRQAFPIVDELANRQKQLNLSMPPELEPFRQHLTHHTLWDAYGGDQTTHDDVIRAMRLAASGPKSLGLLALPSDGNNKMTWEEYLKGRT
jgi:hypothetical protein